MNEQFILIYSYHSSDITQHHAEKLLDKSYLREKRLILALGFRGISITTMAMAVTQL